MDCCGIIHHFLSGTGPKIGISGCIHRTIIVIITCSKTQEQSKSRNDRPIKETTPSAKTRESARLSILGYPFAHEFHPSLHSAHSSLPYIECCTRRHPE